MDNGPLSFVNAGIFFPIKNSGLLLNIILSDFLVRPLVVHCTFLAIQSKYKYDRVKLRI